MFILPLLTSTSSNHFPPDRPQNTASDVVFSVVKWHIYGTIAFIDMDYGQWLPLLSVYMSSLTMYNTGESILNIIFLQKTS